MRAITNLEELSKASPAQRKEAHAAIAQSKILQRVGKQAWAKLCAEFGEPEIAVKVGAVVVTISAGADQKFGTEDDKVVISKPAVLPYEKMLKSQLMEMCEARDLPVMGSSADLIDRLEKSDRK